MEYFSNKSLRQFKAKYQDKLIRLENCGICETAGNLPQTLNHLRVSWIPESQFQDNARPIENKHFFQTNELKLSLE